MEGRLHVQSAPDAHSRQIVPAHARTDGLESAAGTTAPLRVGARAPDFKQALSVNYPNPAGASKTFAIPISVSYKDAKELFVIADVVSAEVIYHYRRAG